MCEKQISLPEGQTDWQSLKAQVDREIWGCWQKTSKNEEGEEQFEGEEAALCRN